MQYNKAIETFLSEQSRKDKTLEAIEKSRAKNLSLKLISELTSAFEQNNRPDNQHIINIIKHNVDDAISLIIDDSISHQKNDNFYVYPLAGHTTAFANRIILSSNEFFDLSIDIIDAQLLNQYKSESKNNLAQRGIQFYGRETISYLINAGKLKVSKWHHKVIDEDYANQKCALLGFQELSDGDAIFNRSNETVMYESAQDNVVLVSLELKRDSAPVTLMFSALDQELKFQNPSSEVDSRI